MTVDQITRNRYVIGAVAQSVAALRNNSGTVVVDWTAGVEINDSSGNLIIDVDAYLIKDLTGATVLDIASRTLKYTDGTTTCVDFGAGILNDSGGVNSVDIGGRLLIDSLGNAIVDWENQQLKTNNGDIAADFANAAKFTIVDTAGATIGWTKATDVKKLYTAGGSAGDLTLPDATGAGMEGCEVTVIAKGSMITVTCAVAGQMTDLDSAYVNYDYAEVGGNNLSAKAVFTVVGGEWCAEWFGNVAFF